MCVQPTTFVKASFLCFVNADLNKVLASRQAQAQQKKQSISEEAPNEVNEKGSVPRQTFLSLHLRLQQLVNHALDSETDPQGMQYLLCGLGTLLQDTVSFEKEALKRQKLANKHQKEPEPSLATGGEEHKNTKAQVREDQPKGEGQLEEKGRIPEVIITHGSVSQDEGVGHGSSRAPLRGVKETANTESLLEEGFSKCVTHLVFICTSVPYPAHHMHLHRCSCSLHCQIIA